MVSRSATPSARMAVQRGITRGQLPSSSKSSLDPRSCSSSAARAWGGRWRRSRIARRSIGERDEAIRVAGQPLTQSVRPSPGPGERRKCSAQSRGESHRRTAACPRGATTCIPSSGSATRSPTPRPPHARSPRAAETRDIELIRAQLRAVSPSFAPGLQLDRDVLDQWADFSKQRDRPTRPGRGTCSRARSTPSRTPTSSSRRARACTRDGDLRVCQMSSARLIAPSARAARGR
jgi:hypothetical protein